MYSTAHLIYLAILLSTLTTAQVDPIYTMSLVYESMPMPSSVVSSSASSTTTNGMVTEYMTTATVTASRSPTPPKYYNSSSTPATSAAGMMTTTSTSSNETLVGVVTTAEFNSDASIPTSLVLATSGMDSLGDLPLSTYTSWDVVGGTEIRISEGSTATVTASTQDYPSYGVSGAKPVKASFLALGVLLLVMVLFA